MGRNATGRRWGAREFGSLLAQLREERGLSQGQLSRDAGCDHSMICRIESGDRNPSAILVDALALAMTLNADERIWLFVRAGLLPPELSIEELDRVAMALTVLQHHPQEEPVKLLRPKSGWVIRDTPIVVPKPEPETVQTGPIAIRTLSPRPAIDQSPRPVPKPRPVQLRKSDVTQAARTLRVQRKLGQEHGAVLDFMPLDTGEPPPLLGRKDMAKLWDSQRRRHQRPWSPSEERMKQEE